VNTGALKRSMAFTHIRGVVTFRELDTWAIWDNSMLEKRTIRLMPRGVQWRIIYTTKFGGDLELAEQDR
jgi:hypothetical protein